MITQTTPAAKLDWDSPGRRIYHVPFTMDGEWGRVRIPLGILVSPKAGKTVVAIGGTHGDEYEGPVAIKRLMHDLDPGVLTAGRLILIPVLNVPAFQAARRDSPLDGGNMNRAFPGDAKGSITKRIARFLTDEVLERADVVVDIHAAGAPMEIARCASFHQIDDPERFRVFRETAAAFGMPFVFVYTGGMGTGLLTSQAEAMGKITIGGEFGYGASTDLQGVRWAYHGLLNVMRFHGLVAEPVQNLLPDCYDRQRVVSATDIDAYVTAPVSGICEPLAEIGQKVRAGDPVVCIHDFDRIDEPGCIIRADRDGYIMTRRFRAATRQGDVVMVIAAEIDG